MGHRKSFFEWKVVEEVKISGMYYKFEYDDGKEHVYAIFTFLDEECVVVSVVGRFKIFNIEKSITSMTECL